MSTGSSSAFDGERMQSFQFNSLPFGLPIAPRVFTKVLRPSDSGAIAECESTVCDISGQCHAYHAPEQGSTCAANLNSDRLASEFQEVSDSVMSGENTPRLLLDSMQKKIRLPLRKSEADTGRGTSPPKSEECWKLS